MRLGQVASMASRGAFILFEGVDRCGKSTQTRLLAQHLSLTLLAVECIRFPDRTSAIGQMINNYLQNTQEMSDEAIHLLFSANRWEAKQSIESKLAAGTTLVCDRYAHSGVAFSAAKGLDMHWCMTPDEGLPAPDCVIFLDIEPEAASQRGEYGAERYEKLEFQHKVRSQFQELRRRIAGERGESDTAWHVLDATKPIDALQEEVRQISARVIAEVAGKPVRQLWNNDEQSQIIN